MNLNALRNKIIKGDCLEVMKDLPDNSIDTIITDPPYGLKFMNKKWDYSIPSVKHFKEMLRVAKPGATLLCFGGTRTWHRIAVNIEDAGWDIVDTLAWCFGSGFPKAQDISKMMMKKLGDKGVKTGEVKHHAQKGVAEERGAIGDGAFGEARNEEVVEPTNPIVKQWKGYKSHALKPAFEPIIMARKRNDGTYVNNALKYGVAGLNIDGARIEHNEDLSVNREERNLDTRGQGWGFKAVSRGNEGRYPANLILGGGAGKYIDEQSGKVGGGHWAKTKITGYGEFGNGKSEYFGVGKKDKTNGGASRYFKNIPLDSRLIYVPKASRSERDRGLENSELKSKNEYDKMGGSKCGMKTGSGNERNTLYHNHHPTVKPLKLMEYLCVLTKTPTGGLVLDPYVGSGTTAIACVNTGRDFIGIELNPEYVKIAEQRLKPILEQKKLSEVIK